MKRFYLFILSALFALTMNAQEMYTDEFTPDMLNGLGTAGGSAALASYTSETTGIEYGFRCTVVDDAFHFNSGASGYQIFNYDNPNSYNIRKITMVGASTTNEAEIKIYGKASEWSMNKNNYPSTPASEGTSLGTIKLKPGEAVSLEVAKYNFEYIDIYTSSAAIEFTSISFEWEEVGTCEFESIVPADGSDIERTDNTFVMNFTGAVKIDAEASYINPAERGSSYIPFESIEPQSSDSEYSRTWTLTVPEDVLDDWPAYDLEVPFTFVIYASDMSGNEILFGDDDEEDGVNYYVGTYYVLNPPEPIIKPDVTTYPAENDEISVLRTFNVYCEEGITMSYAYDDDEVLLDEGRIEVRNASGTKIAGVSGYEYVNGTSIDASYAGLGISFTISTPIKDKGEYSIYIPEKMFILGPEQSHYESNILSDEINVSFSVDGSEQGQLDYVLSPKDNETVGSVSEITITFDGAATLADGTATLMGDDDTPISLTASITSTSANATVVTLALPEELSTSGTYKLNVPAGMFSFSGVLSHEINSTIIVVNGILSTGEIIIYNKVAYMVEDDVTCVGVLAQADYASYEGVDTTGEIEIPAAVIDNGISYKVTGMAVQAFAKNEDITSVIISANITDWGFGNNGGMTGEAFYACKNLTSATLSGITSLGESMFYDCALTEIAIPEGVTSIPATCFAAYETTSQLKTVYLPSTMQSVGGRVFSQCKALRDIYCYAVEPPTTVTENSPTFNGCTVGVITLHVPCESVEAYEESEYWGSMEYDYIHTIVGYDCPAVEEDDIIFYEGIAYSVNENLKSVTIANQVENDVTVEGEVVIPSKFDYDFSDETITLSVTAIAEEAFASYSGITSITLPSTLATWGDKAFYGCSTLAEVNLDEGITAVGDYAFMNVSSLTTVNLPTSLTTLGEGCFYCENSNSITSITSLATTPPSFNNALTAEGAACSFADGCTLYVQCGCGEDYAAAEGWCDAIATIVELDCPDVQVFEELVLEDYIYPNVEGTKYYTFTPEKNGKLTVVGYYLRPLAIYADEYLVKELYNETDWNSQSNYSYDMEGGTTYYIAMTFVNVAGYYHATYSDVWEENDPKFYFDPADGSELESLSTFIIGYTDGGLEPNWGMFEYKDLQVIDANTKEDVTYVKSLSMDVVEDCLQATLNKTITEAGKYTIIFPARTFTDYTQWSDDGTYIIPTETRVTYIVGDYVDGINDVYVNEQASGDIYTLSGQKVNAPTKTGIYIVNGRKVLVK